MTFSASRVLCHSVGVLVLSWVLNGASFPAEFLARANTLFCFVRRGLGGQDEEAWYYLFLCRICGTLKAVTPGGYLLAAGGAFARRCLPA